MSTTGIIFDVKRFAVHDGPGVRTTLFLKGCPLRCLWCHNPESMLVQPRLAYYVHKCLHCGECVSVCPTHAHALFDGKHAFDRSVCTACGACEEACLGSALKNYGEAISVDEAVQIVIEDRDFYGEDGGVTLSGGEPLFQMEFCCDFLKQLKALGIHTAVDTCGCVAWSALEKVLSVADIFLWDFKHSDREEHRRLTGLPNDLILENLNKLVECGARIEVRIPLVPGCNDSEENLSATAKILKKLHVERVRILPYHALARTKYEALGMKNAIHDFSPSEPEIVLCAVDIFRSRGINAE